MATRIKLRRDTSTRWENINPILALAEPGLETDTGKIKYGDGITTWNLLPYFDDQTMELGAVAQNIIPDEDNTYDLGTPAKQWRHVYTAGGSIYLGNVKLTNEDGKLVATTVINPGEENEAPDPVDSNAVSNITSSLVNGEHEFKLESNGTLLLDGEPFSGGTGSTTMTHLRLTNKAISNVPAELGEPVVFVRTAGGDETDTIAPGLTLARGANGALYNIEAQQGYDFDSHAIVGAEWNADDWGDLLDLPQRSYDTLRSSLNTYIGDNIVGAELIMHDTINDQYWKFEFSDWGQNNGGSFAYTRTQITNPNYFTKTDYGNEIDIFVADDPVGTGIAITRGNSQGIYNPFQEEGWDGDDETSPAGTEWNSNGWQDLSDLESRTYTTFYESVGGNLGENVIGRELVMHIAGTNRYFAIKFLSWTSGGNGGGFSYSRREIDVDQINEGVKFADGSVLKSAAGLTNYRIKSTASNGRRIEEVFGSKTVSVTSVDNYQLNTTLSRAGADTSQLWIDVSTSEIDQILDNPFNYGITDYSTMEFSLDQSNWYVWTGSTGYDGTERGYSTAGTFTYNQGDTVYFRYAGGGAPQVWWNKNDLPGGSSNFRGAVIDYHAYTGESTIIGTIHIVDDDGEENITHTEVSSGSSDGENDDLWYVQNEGTISYRRMDGESKTLKIHWSAKVFYGNELYD